MLTAGLKTTPVGSCTCCSRLVSVSPVLCDISILSLAQLARSTGHSEITLPCLTPSRAAGVYWPRKAQGGRIEAGTSFFLRGVGLRSRERGERQLRYGAV